MLSDPGNWYLSRRDNPNGASTKARVKAAIFNEIFYKKKCPPTPKPYFQQAIRWCMCFFILFNSFFNDFGLPEFVVAFDSIGMSQKNTFFIWTIMISIGCFLFNFPKRHEINIFLHDFSQSCTYHVPFVNFRSLQFSKNNMCFFSFFFHTIVRIRNGRIHGGLSKSPLVLWVFLRSSSMYHVGLWSRLYDCYSLVHLGYCVMLASTLTFRTFVYYASKTVTLCGI